MRRIKHEQQNCLFNFVCGAHSLLVVGAAEGVGVGMNREEIIRMAREAGLVDNDFEPSEWCVHEYMAFAALVASAEREACAKAMAYLVMTPTLTHGALVKLSDVVNAIRARGQA